MRWARPDLRAIPETARIVEVTAGRTARCPPAVAQDGQLPDLDAHVPFVRAALFYDGTRQPRPGAAVALLFLLRAGVADLDRALIRELTVVVLVVVVRAWLLPAARRTMCVIIVCTAEPTDARIYGY